MNPTPLTLDQFNQRVAQADRVWLFLDYDGTLAELAPTPDHIEPNAEVVVVVSALADHPRIRVSVISGRRLEHVEKLVPVEGILLAGTYGVEMRMPEGERKERIPFDAVRPALERIKPHWAELIAGHEGFFLEDKGWALAIHARFADPGPANQVLSAARQIAQRTAASGPFRVLGGHRFLEIGPKLAHKGKTVAHLIDRWPEADALPLYLGDDDKDEEAFDVIHAHGGYAVVVASEPRETEADFRFPTPQTTRQWLSRLPKLIEAPSTLS